MSAAVKKTSTKPPSRQVIFQEGCYQGTCAETPTPAPVSNPLPQASASNEVVASEPVVTIESSMNELLTDFSSSIQSLTLALNKLKNDFRTLEKHVLKEARSMDKVNKAQQEQGFACSKWFRKANQDLQGFG